MRHTTEAIVGAVAGHLAVPSGVLLGRYDDEGRLRYAGRSLPLTQHAAAELARLLRPAAAGHPWQGWSFSAGWGRRELLQVDLVMPELVAEVSADIARDAAGRWRHPVRYVRIRAEMHPMQVPNFGEPD